MLIVKAIFNKGWKDKDQCVTEQTHNRVVYEKEHLKINFFYKKELLLFSITLRLTVSATLFHLTFLPDKSHAKAENITFSGAPKSLLFKKSSEEHCTPGNFVLLMTLREIHNDLIAYLIEHQMKLVM